MTKLIPLLALGLSLSLSQGMAHADEQKAPTAQQNKMTMCNKEAGERKGEERKKFMSECLKAKPAATSTQNTTQQDRMRQCNADAKGKTGEERKKFMSECLRAK
jgi:hypothetical protein